MSRRGLLVLAALAALVSGCGGADGTSSSGEGRTVRGWITDVRSTSILEVESITVETETGESYVLEAGGRILSGFTPSHLREHMLQGTLVTITFHQEGERMALDDVRD